MRVKVIIEAFIDHMPEVDECIDIAGMDCFAGREAVDKVTRDAINDEGHFIGLIEDDYRVLDVVAVETSKVF
jgi:hypothetical protein